MTKFRQYDDPTANAQRWGVQGSLAFVLAVFLGSVIGWWAGDSGSDPRPKVVQIAEKIPETRHVSADRPRDSVMSIRIGDWPESAVTRQETRTTPIPKHDGPPAIAIVIDDLGANAARTKDAIALPAKITLSFLPYALASRDLSHRAHLDGHEIIVHLPMEPLGSQNPGEKALEVGLKPAELQERIDWALSRVSDYDGVNNHMGSRFTASRTDLAPVMKVFKERGLFFLDSRTTAKTQAEGVARDLGILTGSRDIFLDADASPAAIAQQLERAETYAREHGSVIVIGHPYPETLRALGEWSKSIKSHDFRLMSVGDILKLRQAEPTTVVSALTPRKTD